MRKALIFQFLFLIIGVVFFSPAISIEQERNDNIVILSHNNETFNLNSAKEENKDPYVYITKTGKKYHRETCSYLKKSKIKIRLSEAKRLGYTPCSSCKPPR